MNEKEFDDKIKQNLKDPLFKSPQWSKMTAMLNSELPLEDLTEFDQIIQNDLENIEVNSSSNWDLMESMISNDNILNDNSFDINIASKVAALDANALGSPDWDRMNSALNQPMPTEDADKLLAAKILSFVPNENPKWNLFEQQLDQDIPLTKEIHLFDNQLKRAISGIATTQSPNWDTMNFMLDSDTILGVNTSFDQHIKDAVDQPGAGNSAESWSHVESSMNLQENRNKRIFGSKTLELSLMLVLLAATPLLMNWINNSLPTLIPSESEEKAIMADSEQNIAAELSITNTIESSIIETSVNATALTEKISSELKTSDSPIANSFNTNENSLSENITSTNKNGLSNTYSHVSAPMPILDEENITHPIVLASYEEGSSTPIMISSSSAENIESQLSFAALPTLINGIDNGLIVNRTQFKDPVNNTSLSLSESNNWKPYVGAFAGTQVLELKLEQLDRSYKISDKTELAYSAGVAAGFSKGNLDIEAGIGRMQVNFAGGLERSGAFHDSIVQTSPTIIKDKYRLGYKDSKISAWMIPISAKYHLPIEKSKFDLYFKIGVTGTRIVDAPDAYEDVFVSRISGEEPQGGNVVEVLIERDEKITTEFIEAQVGVGLAYKINNRSRVIADINLDLPFADKKIGHYRDSWSSYTIGVGVQYFLK